MVKKKKGDVGAEGLLINSEEDWINLKNKKGLVIVDVYAKWAGPCDVMKPIINKIKNALVQSGEDIVEFTSACSDTIPSLGGFKNICMPIFLIVASGDIVAFIHGADGKKMKDIIKDQVKKELQNQKDGNSNRNTLAIEDTIPTITQTNDETD